MAVICGKCVATDIDMTQLENFIVERPEAIENVKCCWIVARARRIGEEKLYCRKPNAPRK